MINVAAYTRVSSEEQVDGYSLDVQKDVISQHCKQKGWNIVRFYTDDGFSAKSFNRPNWTRLKEDIKEKRIKIQKVVIVRASRFSRSGLLESLEMERDFNELGVQVYTIEQQYDLDIPENLLPHYLKYILPEIDNRRRSANVTAGMRKAMLSGRYVSGPPPMGYKYNEEKNIIPDEEKAPMIKEAFTRFATGKYVMDQLRLDMKVDGFPVPSRNSFRRMFDRVIYKGLIKVKAYKKEPEQIVKGIHKPLVSVEIWQKCQDVINGKSRKQKKKQSNGTNYYPLRGVLCCPDCGKKVTASASTGKSKKRYHYYHCVSSCGYRVNAVDANVGMEILMKKLTFNEDWAKLGIKMLNEILGVDSKSNASKLGNYRKEAKEIQARIDRLVDLYIDGKISEDKYNETNKRLEGEKERVKVQMASLDGITKTSEMVEEAFGFLKNLHGTYFNLSPVKKQVLVSSIFPNKLVFVDGIYRTLKINSLLTIKPLKIKGLELIEGDCLFKLSQPIHRVDEFSNSKTVFMGDLEAIYRFSKAV